MRKLYSLIILVFAVVGLGFFVEDAPLINSSAEARFKSKKKVPEFIEIESPWVDSIVNSLTLEQKIAQLIMYPVYSKKGEKELLKIEKLIDDYEIGGLIYMQGGPVRQVNAHNRLMAKSKIPLLTSIDGEWGVRMRLDSVIRFPRQMLLGAVQDETLVYDMGVEIAKQCSLTGVHVNFAPVVDLNVNPNNPVINSRSFGEEKVHVTKLSNAYMKGMQDNTVLACAKHFPGHGDTDVDSHLGLPVINHSKDRLMDVELYPFKALIDSGIGSVMVAHLYVPALDKTKDRASTLSPKIVKKLLKEKLGFKGLTFTDALNMHGVSKYYETGEVDLLALLAGNDILLFSQDVGKAIEYIKNAVDKRKISEKEITARVKKVIQLKKWIGLDSFEPLSTKELVPRLNSENAKLVRRKLVENAMTLLQNRGDVVPVKGLSKLKLASVSIGVDRISPFQKMLGNYAPVDHFYISSKPTKEEVIKVIKDLKGYNLTLVGIHGNSRSPKKQFGLTQDMMDVLNNIKSMHPTIVSVFANPYSLGLFPELSEGNALIMAYENALLSQEYAAQLIFGGIDAKGKLPVTVSERFQVGDGLVTKKKRLKYSIPIEEGFNPEKLKKVDSIVLNGIDEKAYPGAQVLIARRGNIIYNKSFGHHTYEKKRKVNCSDMYDLASITKITASVPNMMKLVESGDVNLDYNLCDYLGYVDTTNYINMNLRRMLAHNAGLVSWIPFYTKTMARGQLKFDVYSNTESNEYKNKVTDGLYIRKEYSDSIRNWIINHGIHKKQDYRYSDLGYYFYKDIIEKQTGTRLDYLSDSLFYKPLGASTLTYRPLEKFSKDKIAPTENDMFFRKKLVHGTVHDPGAAMLGGVAGHAGLFSNANDLAKMFAMYMNNGEYGGERYIDSAVVAEFTKVQFPEEENRRGAGFDKPSGDENGPTCECVSEKSFGHTGFTGTLAWADPEKEIIYIFLSNRVYPDAENKKLIRMNVRTHIQEAIYAAIED
ncbi:MAG: glycoside hydrolase family 3 N-terminal domain-containing protein [Flavobacteriales bacterium]